MEISLKYIFLKLDSAITFLLAMFYLIGDTINAMPERSIKDGVSIWTGISIAMYYFVKTFRAFEEKTKISVINSEIETIKSRLDKLEKSIQTKSEL